MSLKVVPKGQIENNAVLDDSFASFFAGFFSFSLTGVSKITVMMILKSM